MVTWLPVARPGVPSTRFLCSVKAAGLSNLDSAGARGMSEPIPFSARLSAPIKLVSVGLVCQSYTYIQ